MYSYPPTQQCTFLDSKWAVSSFNWYSIKNSHLDDIIYDDFCDFIWWHGWRRQDMFSMSSHDILLVMTRCDLEGKVTGTSWVCPSLPSSSQRLSLSTGSHPCHSCWPEGEFYWAAPGRSRYLLIQHRTTQNSTLHRPVQSYTVYFSSKNAATAQLLHKTTLSIHKYPPLLIARSSFKQQNSVT